MQTSVLDSSFYVICNPVSVTVSVDALEGRKAKANSSDKHCCQVLYKMTSNVSLCGRGWGELS